MVDLDDGTGADNSLTARSNYYYRIVSVKNLM
jgi:hypothetical protein